MPVPSLLALALLVLQSGAAEEYKAKLAQLQKNAAAKHWSIGDSMATSQMHQWAREQYNKTIELDPNHENARKRLGFKKGEDGTWESDPSIKQEFGNRKKGEDAERVRKTYVEKQEQAGKDLARQWGDLALFAKKNMMPEECEAAFRKALEYDPANATARKELGYEKDPKGVWISKVERDLRREMREGIAKAPAGKASSEAGDLASTLGLTLKRRESDHFRVESPHLTEPQMGAMLQHAEHTYAIFHKIFGAQDLFGEQKKVFLTLKDKAQHEKYVDLMMGKAEKARVDLAKKSRAMGGWPVAELYQETAPEGLLHDWVVHSTVESLLRRMGVKEYCWILEGLALHFTRLMKDTASLHCVDLAGTTPQNKGKNYSEPADWPVVCRVWVRENKDPDITAILKCTNFAEIDGAETVKAWSLVEFLLAEHRPKFVELLSQLKADAEPEAAFREVWGWTIQDLDFRWKQYVRVTY
jgi:tetratricopeptide (TPR) repeat protein